MIQTDTIQLTVPNQYKQILKTKTIPQKLSIWDFFKLFGVSDIIKAKILKKKHYNPNDDTYWPFDSASKAIAFLKRYK